MKALKYLAIVLGAFFLFAACQKELSFENGLPVAPAAGSLKSLSGNCMPAAINGKYVKNTSLTDSNSVTVQVNITAPGSYIISTDTANGFSFHGSGVVADSGLQSIILKGTGTPAVAQQTNFTVSFDSTVCMFSINVTDSLITPPVTSGDYFPTGDSSNWTYQLNPGDPLPEDTARIEASKTDTIIAGNTYRIFVFAGDNYENYFRKGAGLYYEYGDFDNRLLDAPLSATVNDKVDYIFLKDNVSVGSTWESPEVNATLATIAGKAKIRFTIGGKDVQNIGTTINDSVIQVKREYMFSPSSPSVPYQTVVTAYFYYAKNIGFIKAELADDPSSGLYLTHSEIRF